MLVMEDRCLRSDRIHAINFLVRDEEVWRIGANQNTVGSMSPSTERRLEIATTEDVARNVPTERKTNKKTKLIKEES